MLSGKLVEKVLLEIAHQIDPHDTGIETPAALDSLKGIVIATRNDGLQGQNVGLLNDRTVATSRGRIRPVLDFDERIRREMSRTGRAIGVETRRRLVHLKYRRLPTRLRFRARIMPGLDAAMGKKVRDAWEVSPVDEFRVAVEQVFDLACAVGHA